MIDWNNTKTIHDGRQNNTHVWAVCDACGSGRWINSTDAKRGKNSGYCRTCSNVKAWDGKRIDLTKGQKVCADCGQCKPFDEFSADSRKRGNMRSYCKQCAAARIVKYRKENQEVYRANKRAEKARRRARMRGAGGDFSEQEWQDILNRYGHKCLGCGATKDLQPDHVIPLSVGGTHSKANIQPLCGRCNREKQAKTIDYR